MRFSKVMLLIISITFLSIAFSNMLLHNAPRQKIRMRLSRFILPGQALLRNGGIRKKPSVPVGVDSGHVNQLRLSISGKRHLKPTRKYSSME